jgi:hypothetical protein
MACNCLETSKEKILAKLAEIHPDYNISDSVFQNRIWCFEGPQDVILTHRFDYTYIFKKVNATDSEPRTSNININPIYCGFCGKKFVEDEPTEN